MTAHVSFIMPAMFESLATRLEGRLVVLEPLGPEHEEGLRAAAADERIWQWMLTRDVEVWIADALRPQPTTGSRSPCSATARWSARRATCALAPEHRRLEIGNTWLNPSAWGTGANTEAKYLLLRHAFEELGCLRVEFKTDALNERARAALAAIPSEFEGIHRWHMVVRGGERRDSAWYAVTSRLAGDPAGARSTSRGLDFAAPGIRYGTGAFDGQERQRDRSRPRRARRSPRASRSAASSCATRTPS